MTNYTAIAERSGDWWAVTIDGLSGVFTQAKRLDQIEELAADAIGLWLEEDPATIHVDVQVHLPAELQRLVDEARSAREAAKWAGIAAATSTTTAVTTLSMGGFSMRDAGHIIDVSHQRIGQILKEDHAGEEAFLEAVAELQAHLQAMVETARSGDRTKGRVKVS